MSTLHTVTMIQVYAHQSPSIQEVLTRVGVILQVNQEQQSPQMPNAYCGTGAGIGGVEREEPKAEL